MLPLIAQILISSLISIPIADELLASETDQFTDRATRSVKLKDSLEPLDQWMNDRLDSITPKIKVEMTHATRIETIRDDLLSALTPDLLSAIESYFDDHPEIVDRYILPDRGIYLGTGITEARISFFVGLAPTLKVDGVLMGKDKLGHFLSQGFQFYKFYLLLPGRLLEEEKLRSLRDLGYQQEAGYLGLTTDGVFSMADIAANWAGFRFWDHLFDGENPYFAYSKNDRKWVRNARFSFSDYVNDDWDEMLNPSYVSSKDMLMRIQANIEKQCKLHLFEYVQQKRQFAMNENYRSDLMIPANPINFSCRPNVMSESPFNYNLISPTISYRNDSDFSKKQ